MPRLDVTLDHPLLVRVLRDPNQLPSLSPHEVSRLIDVAEEVRLLGWLKAEIDRRSGALNHPTWLQDRIVAIRALVREYERALRWEADRLDRAFSGTGISWILLKGAAYVAAGLPPGRGRHVADIDVLVPFDALGRAERTLGVHGWHIKEINPYDERYYREWMHELPPMTHEERHSVVDVHHAILPRTSRLRPSAERLHAMAVTTSGGARVLCPAHMVLHGAVHLFHDGEISGAIRDVVDLDSLLRHFGADPVFWNDLLTETMELGLARPAYYALRYSNRLLNTPIPDVVQTQMTEWAPPGPVRGLMDSLVERTLPGQFRKSSSAAVLALYVRSHWLRMPPFMLARHLLRKSVRRQETKKP